MRATRRPCRRLVAHGLAAVLLLGACGRGVSEQRVSSPGTEPGAEVTDATPPPEATTSTIPAEPTTTSAPEPATTSSTVLAPTATTTTGKPKAGDPCASPTVTDFPLSAPGGKPAELVVAPDGVVWFTDNGAAAVGRLAPDGTVRMFPVSAGRQPASIGIGPGGEVWFTQYAWSEPAQPGDPPPATPGPSAIGRIGLDGTVTEFPLPTQANKWMGGDDPLSSAGPGGITAGPDGAMWFTESGAGQIGRIGPDGVITEYPVPRREGSPGSPFPYGIIPGPDGALWFHEQIAARLGRIDPGTKVITEYELHPRPSNRMEWSSGGPLVRGPDGGFWFGDWLTTIYRVGTSGLMTPFRIAPPADGIRAIVAGPDGQLWFADQRSPAVFRMTTKGVVTKLWVPPGAPKAWESFGGMTVAPDGAVWVTQPWANKITRLSCRS